MACPITCAITRICQRYSCHCARSLGGNRIYTEGDLELLTWVACLSASGVIRVQYRTMRSGLGYEP